MSALTPEVDRQPLRAVRAINPVITASEVLAIYAAVLLYIWRWQDAHPFLWLPMLAVVVFSQWFCGETLEELGVTGMEFWPCARASLPLLAVVIGGAVCYGLWVRYNVFRFASWHVWLSLGGYFVWCSFQQYLTQSYFHRQLMKVMQSPHLRSLAIGLLFAGAHIPNPILMAATFAGGIVFAEIFFRHRNIWPLAFVQAVAGFLIGMLAPPWIIHGMRVGPGYFLFHVR
ncbi:MAG TPA: CPBP family glutamic-type intramembrane protease [Terriglobia bacterium]|nr:CPBP family glutamic-type intramembrane protease [Terriglobia bacterium]